MLKLARKSLYSAHCKIRTSENGANLLRIIDSYQIASNSFKVNNTRCTQDVIKGQKWSKTGNFKEKWAKMTRKLVIFPHRIVKKL